ncbi:MAG TPA: hypothetical protein VID29_10680 [Solirubrobacteraceae bacterium]|jgi:hypothetical protein
MSTTDRVAAERIRIGVVLALGSALAVTLLAAALTRSPPTVAGTNSVRARTELGATRMDNGLCQGRETLPAGTSAIRASLLSLLGPRLTVTVFANGGTLTRGERGSGWTTAVVTVPVERVARTTEHATVCFAFDLKDQLITVFGQPTSKRALAAVGRDGKALPGRLRIEYLRAGTSPWWKQALSIARRMGLAHTGTGAWIAPILLLLFLFAAGLSLWLVRRELA